MNRVGGWVGELYKEERKRVSSSCMLLLDVERWVGGWVGGWVDESTRG